MVEIILLYSSKCVCEVHTVGQHCMCNRKTGIHQNQYTENSPKQINSCKLLEDKDIYFLLPS